MSITSAIDPTKPLQGNATTESVRLNFAACKDEIEGLSNGTYPHSNFQTDTLATTGNATFGADVRLGDDQTIYLGDGDDFFARHTGTGSILRSSTGILFIDNLSNSDNIQLRANNSVGTTKLCGQFGGSTPYARFYHDENERLATDPTGITLAVGGTVPRITFDTNDFLQYNKSSNEFQFRVGNVDCITAGGTTPNVELHYDGNKVFQTISNGFESGTVSDTGASIGMDYRNDAGFIRTSRVGTGSATHRGYYNGNGLVGSVQTSGTTTAYNTTSDKRLKTSTGLVQNAVDQLLPIEVHDFYFNTDPDTLLHGFMAQDVHTVYPQVVSKPDDPEDRWGIDQSKFTPLLVAAVQELNNRLAKLEAPSEPTVTSDKLTAG